MYSFANKLLFILFLSVPLIAYSQEMKTDSLIVVRNWTDSNGKNTLRIKVDAACNPEVPPYDAHPTKIEAWLRNDNYSTYIEYDDPNFEMEMIYLNESDICFGNGADRVRIVFIPFSYCGNADDDMIVSYIILYNNQKYLYHINTRDQSNNFAGPYLLDDDLDTKLKDLPENLRAEFLKLIKSKYDLYTRANEYSEYSLDISDDYKLVYLEYDPEFCLYKYPYIVHKDKPLTIWDFVGGYYFDTDIKISPDKKFLAMKRVSAGYEPDENDNPVYYKISECVIVDVQRAKVLLNNRLNCEGYWDENNRWVESKGIIFDPVSKN